jgi:GNAT superfamily N-acetyltransferase
MRRLFYRFSEKSVYYRYFTSIPSMPHSKIQEYTNVDYKQVLSVVGLVGEPGAGRIIAEGRFCRDPESEQSAELALVVDEAYQNVGIASFLCRYLARLAKERGISSFTGYVQASNRTMMRVIEKGEWEVQASIVQGAYQLVMDLSSM